MMAKCSKCGSHNLHEFSAEFAFARPDSSPVYALEEPAVCLECGSSESFTPEDTLTQLRVETNALFTAHVSECIPAITKNCGVCGSSNVKTFSAVVAFGRGLAPPVHVVKGPIVSTCLECGFSEFSVPEVPFAQLRSGVSPQSSRSALEPLPRRTKSA